MRKIHTFDIFDTLVARRCVSPINVFLEIERDLNVANFTQMRTRAEQTISNFSHNLDSIYDELVRNYGITQDVAESLKNVEIDYEIKNAIPIQENIDKVQDGDVLITDMYLPRKVIESILKKIGLRKQVGLIISNKGKESGDVWPKLKNTLLIEQHLGDNLHSDVSSPLSNGILGIHVENHKLSNVESYFESNGFSGLSRVIRETRLGSFTGNIIKQQNEQRMLQINCNMPMLMMVCAHIHLTATEHGVTQILFSSRDCFMLHKLYQYLAKSLNWSEDNCYFFTSRLSRLNSSDTYVSYFKSLNSGKSLVVDMCGTGWSLGQLYFKSKLEPSTYLVHYLKNTTINNEYEKIRSFKSASLPFFLSDDSTINNSIIEFANYTFSGMLLDVKSIDGYDSFIPEFENPNYPPAVIETLEQIQISQEMFVNTLKNHNLISIMNEINLNISKVPTIFVELYKYMSQNSSCMLDIAEYHYSQDKKSMLRLKNS